MENKYLTLEEIQNWFNDNTDTKIPMELLTSFVTKFIIKPNIEHKYPLNLMQEIMLEKDNGTFKQIDGKFIIKDVRKKLIELYFNQNNTKKNNTDFKLSLVKGNKLKLIKIK